MIGIWVVVERLIAYIRVTILQQCTNICISFSRDQQTDIIPTKTVPASGFRKTGLRVLTESKLRETEPERRLEQG